METNSKVEARKIRVKIKARKKEKKERLDEKRTIIILRKE